MLSPQASKVALERLLRRRRAVELTELYRTLGTSSRMSVFRRLRAVGYRTSFTHRGRYYTLEDIPDFDASGLWFHEDVGFSIYGTLKSTLVEIVEQSVEGRTHEDFRRLLRTRSHDTLLDLVRDGKLAREKPGGQFVYLSADPARAADQLAARVGGVTLAEGPPPLSVVIDVLLEVIRAADVYVEPEDVVVRLGARGIVVSTAQVREVYAIHDLTPGKKTREGLRSGSSRR